MLSVKHMSLNILIQWKFATLAKLNLKLCLFLSRHIFVSVSNQDLDEVDFLVFIDLRWKVVTCFVSIGWIVDHRYFNVISIKWLRTQVVQEYLCFLSNICYWIFWYNGNLLHWLNFLNLKLYLFLLQEEYRLIRRVTLV
jgi:hypothetical protein